MSAKFILVKQIYSELGQQLSIYSFASLKSYG